MVRSPRLIAPAAVLACLFAVAVAGCGGGTAANAQNAATDEGTYLEVGGLKYQIQISRQLNPTDGEDRGYLIGVPGGQTQPAAGDVWFGVFMRVENDGNAPHMATGDYSITDTQGDTFRPVPLANTNVFAYRPSLVQPGALIPVRNSAPSEGPIQGSLLLFKLKTADLQNRPLILHIGQGPQSRSVEIDL